MSVLIRLGLAIAPALLLGLYAWYPALAFLPWIAIVPWVLLYTDDRRGKVSWGYYVLGAYVAWILQYTQAWRFGWFAPFSMGLFFLVWWIPFAPLLTTLHRRLRLPRSLSVALAWTTVEWLRSTFAVSHFDLYGIGYSQARFPVLVQFADVTGAYGMSFLMAAANGWIADWILERREHGWAGAFRVPRVRWGLISIVVALGLACGYGVWRLGTIRHEPGPSLALVQPNTPHTQRNMVGVHLTQLLMTVRGVPDEGVDLIVWPENAILDNIRREGAYLDDLAWVARKKGAWFVVGALGKRPEEPGRTTNGAWLIDPDGEIRGHYDKQVLFPWSEYIPGDAVIGRVFPGLQRLYRMAVRIGWGFQPTGARGKTMEVLEFPWDDQVLRFGALICVENTYAPIPAAAGQMGADFFLNITSEGTVGGPVQEQLLRIAMFRAIENRMSYVRVGNTGISGVIDSVGRARAILRGAGGSTINTEGILVAEVPLSHSPRTLYSRSRDLFIKLVVAATFLLVVVSWFRPRRIGVAAVSLLFLLAGCTSPPPLGGDGERVDDNLARGRQLFADGRPSEAIEPLAAACATEEGCRLALPLLLAAYERGKADDNAILLFREIGERYPSLRAEALSYEGVFRNRTIDLPGALEVYRESLALQPSARVHGLVGNLLMRMDRIDEAIEEFRRGLALAPDEAQLSYVLGRALRIRGDYDEAERILEDLVSRVPTHGNAWTNLGRIRMAQGDPEAAMEAFRGALRVEPDLIEARFMIAQVAFRQEDYETVEEMIREIREIEDRLGKPPGSRG